MINGEYEIPKLTKEFMKEFRINTRVRQDIVKLGKCNRCGFCCISTYPEMSQEEISRLAKYFKMKIIDFVHVHCTENPVTGMTALKRPCPFFKKDDKGDDKGLSICTIYKVRPETCKEFPFANDSLEYGPCMCGNNIVTDLLKTNVLPNQILEGWEKFAKDHGVGIEKITDPNYWQDTYRKLAELYDDNKIKELEDLDEKLYPTPNNIHIRLIIWKGKDLRVILDALRTVKKMKDDKDGIKIAKRVFGDNVPVIGYKFSAELPDVNRYAFNFKVIGIEDDYVSVELCI
jgi:Fe-S-cluster containining protein